MERKNLLTNMMTDLEFDILDELYFLQSFDYLMEQLAHDQKVIAATLSDLYRKGWIRCYSSPSDELACEDADILKEYDKYHYLATKEGLLAHNGN